MFVISWSPAPLPPSTSFIVPLPSAWPSPKKYTSFSVTAPSAAAASSVVCVMSNVLSLGAMRVFLARGRRQRRRGTIEHRVRHAGIQRIARDLELHHRLVPQPAIF